MSKKNGYNILHLEDDSFDAEMTQNLLDSEGIDTNIDVVDNESEFIERLNSKAYALIISDFELPSFNGMQALKIAKKISPQTPFILSSGVIGEEMAADCIKQGAIDYILKSSTSRLVASVKRVLKESDLVASTKKSEDRLIESGKRFKAIYETTLDGIITMDQKGDILEFNPAAERIFGYKRNKVLGKSMADLIIPKHYHKIHKEGLMQFIKTRKPKILELTALNVNGHEFPVAMAIHGMQIGDSPEFTAFIQDISIRKEAEEKIKSLNEELELKVEQRTQKLQKTLAELKHAQSYLVQSEKMASLGQLTAGVAHELNNPINFVGAGASALDKDVADMFDILDAYEKAGKNNGNQISHKGVDSLKAELEYEELKDNIQQTLADMKIGVMRTADIVKGLHKFTQMDTKEKVMFNIHEGLDETLTILGHEIKARIKVVKHYATDIKKIPCYPGQLNQVFMNILTNAGQAIEKQGTITITTSAEKNKVTISIADNGTGMSKEVQEHIFDPFYTTKAVGSGVGLGMSIAYGIIEKHEGAIEVKSEEGKGSEFIITLFF